MCTIAQRGVAMVGTAHGASLHSLIRNPSLVPLLGGIQVMRGAVLVFRTRGDMRVHVHVSTCVCVCTV